MKILWVEDNTDEVIALADSILYCNQDLTILESASEADNYLTNEKPADLIILDSFMPGSGKPSHSGCTLFVSAPRTPSII